ncbi:bifunctional riboflavin kinase/FAD synthetase, partial [Xanthomonas oryzae pv. oryzae]
MGALPGRLRCAAFRLAKRRVVSWAQQCPGALPCGLTGTAILAGYASVRVGRLAGICLDRGMSRLFRDVEGGTLFP